MTEVAVQARKEAETVPFLIEIEPAKGCNLQCVMCHVPTEKNKRPIYLDIDVLEKATKGTTNCHVILGSEYEPTIHPKFEDILRLAIKRNWQLDFLTNGTKLHKYDQGLLADVPFHVFNASFDGAFKNSFELVRVGANYEAVKKNIITTAALVREKGAATAINATMLNSNMDETAQLVEMWGDEGFDLVRLFIMQGRGISAQVLSESLFGHRKDLYDVFRDVADTLLKKNLSIGVRNGFYASKKFEAPKQIHLHDATIYNNSARYKYVRGVRQEFLRARFKSS